MQRSEKVTSDWRPEWLRLSMTTSPPTKSRWVRRAMFVAGLAVSFAVPSLAMLGFSITAIAWFWMRLAELQLPQSTFMRRRNVQFRLVGLAMTTGGGIFFVLGLVSSSAHVEFVFFGLLFVASGLVLLTRRSFRPDLGDSLFSERTRQRLGVFHEPFRPPPPSDDRPRDWWTGDPIEAMKVNHTE